MTRRRIFTTAGLLIVAIMHIGAQPTTRPTAAGIPLGELGVPRPGEVTMANGDHVTGMISEFNGKVTINNKKGAAVLDMIAAQIGKTTPRDVTTYQEGEAHTAFVEGNAAFMRNWPYAYSVGQDPKSSKIVGKFSVTVLPHGPSGRSVATVGGWQLGVNKYSKHIDASIELVRYMTSAAAQKFNAITNTNVPTIPAVAKDPAVVKVNPYLKPSIATVARVPLRSRKPETSTALAKACWLRLRRPRTLRQA